MQSIDNKVKIFNQMKVDLIKMSQCISVCPEEEQEFYQDVALNYSKQLKSIKESLEKIYGVKVCNCCSFSKE